MKLKVGDIFEFSINENSKSYGQIVSVFKKDALSIIVFEGQYRSRPDIEELLQDNILLFGNTFDAKFHHNHWMIIGNETSNLSSIKLPYYKIGTEPIYIEDFFEKKLREAKGNEESILNYRSYIAPVRFETALKAFYKVVEWREEFDELLYSNVLKSAEIKI